MKGLERVGDCKVTPERMLSHNTDGSSRPSPRPTMGKTTRNAR